MASIVKNLMEISGLADTLPENPASFKQFTIHVTLSLPEATPDIEQIIKVASKVIITGTRVIRTPKLSSPEGQILTGFELIAEGEIRHRIEYIACETAQSVHAVHFTKPFRTFIVLPPDYIFGTPITATGYIEDIFADILDERTVITNITLFLNAVF